MPESVAPKPGLDAIKLSVRDDDEWVGMTAHDLWAEEPTAWGNQHRPRDPRSCHLYVHEHRRRDIGIRVPASLPNGTVGISYSQQITASGGAAPFTFALVSGALPGGLALGPSGLLAGVPAAGTEGTYIFRVRATDTSGCTSDRDDVLIIAAAVPVLPPGLLLVMALLLLAVGALVMRRRGPV